MSGARLHGLLIGIDRYPYLDPDQHLRGSVADAVSLAEVFQARCPEAQLQVLLNEEATQERVRSGLRALIDRVSADEEVLFYWSGHGSQVRNLEGGDAEEDGWDETLVPYDSGRGEHPNRDLIDDEIYLWIGELAERTQRITLIFDSCHSGTAARSGARGVPRDGRPLEGSTASMAEPNPRLNGSSGWLPPSRKYVLLSACRDDQKAYEARFRGEARGTFSWALEKTLATSREFSSWQELFDQAAHRVAVALGGIQIPQIEGNRGRALPWVG